MTQGKKPLALLLAVLLLCGILSVCGQTSQPVTSDTLSVQKVENLPEDFILGMDASCVPALEAGGVKYYDQDGVEKDVFRILAENGINYIRVRVWNHPYDAEGRGYGGGNCDMENALAIGLRAKEYGLKLLVDFHYSDFWADPGKQQAPKAWQTLSLEEKSQALYEYTRTSLQKLADAGVDVGMVQIGNETNGAFCGESSSQSDGWQKICQLMNAGAKAVREVCPQARIVLHFTNPERAGSYEDYSAKLSYYQVDYDVFASSYYPFWHGTLENLTRVLSRVAETYGKQVMVAETSYPFTAEDADFHGNTVGSGNALPAYPISQQGQADLVRDVVAAVANDTTGGVGVFYWEGTWISAGGSSYEENRALWQQYGSGWASSYAGEYDPVDAGKWYGGCAVDNQAFFTARGRATEALKVFALLRTGNSVNLE